jgi:hypothetical protein
MYNGYNPNYNNPYYNQMKINIVIKSQKMLLIEMKY